jgi:hypothetical protein
MKRLFRNAHVGLAVGMFVAIVGVAFLHGNESALNALSVAVIVTTMGVFVALSIRDERARGKDGPHSS